jgi:REP element-mobilizing transposase RayT
MLCYRIFRHREAAAMPRQARLDAPGTLHHVIVRGLERGAIVKNDADRAAFVTRLGEVAQATGTRVYAWALLPNHAHLLVRSGPTGLPAFMRRLLTGYAITFNQRHKRLGHLFQNRYKSIVVEEDSYFRELVRYIHLNPLRAKLAADLGALARYPWSGHATVVGRIPRPWQDRQAVLGWFGSPARRAIRAYQTYVRESIPQGRRPELVGGGLVRSLGGWAEVRALRPRQEPMAGDPRILGSGPFVEQMVREGVGLAELQTGSRRGRLPQIRTAIIRHLVTGVGLPSAAVARLLEVSTSAVVKCLQRVGRRYVHLDNNVP